ncbi:hypothetical protein X839_04225 [Streptococcus thermophilus MTH17CL396]|uniref:YdhK family protein n=1 Tax=Streptococcus thermophilus TaxID=1308 RepID=UPI0003E4A4A1|nr:YdhK family protein [Streptococcus thermophilus]ETW90445.1 hypothetical protein X839_04225 [Streptococcus thermophilus MTH17CL396]
MNTVKKMIKLVFASLGIIVFLGACSNQSGLNNSKSTNEESTSIASSKMNSMEGMNHEGMVPSSMKDAVNPKFPVGSNVILLADHMKGMKGAKAQVVGAFDTTIYEVSYKPKTGGPMVKNHRWVVQEELKDTKTVANEGDTVILNADHMDGMMGAEAKVDKSIKGTVYVVNYTPTDGQKEVKNHMWVTEDEMEYDKNNE